MVWKIPIIRSNYPKISNVLTNICACSINDRITEGRGGHSIVLRPSLVRFREGPCVLGTVQPSRHHPYNLICVHIPTWRDVYWKVLALEWTISTTDQFMDFSLVEEENHPKIIIIKAGILGLYFMNASIASCYYHLIDTTWSIVIGCQQYHRHRTHSMYICLIFLFLDLLFPLFL